MKLLRDNALFADSERVRIQSMRALAKFGRDSAPYVSEVLDSTSEPGVKRFCTEVLARIKSNASINLLIGSFALAPYLIAESCNLDSVPY